MTNENKNWYPGWLKRWNYKIIPRGFDPSPEEIAEDAEIKARIDKILGEDEREELEATALQHARAVKAAIEREYSRDARGLTFEKWLADLPDTPENQIVRALFLQLC